jgi:hypothetical protein
MPDKKYTQDDFGNMSFRAGALKDFAETLTWADTYAEIPEAEPETIAQ